MIFYDKNSLFLKLNCKIIVVSFMQFNVIAIRHTSVPNEGYILVLHICHAFFVYYENADLVYDVIRMRQLSKQTLHELSPIDNS